MYVQRREYLQPALAVRTRSPPKHHPRWMHSLQASVTSTVDNVLGTSSGGSGSNVLALEVGKEASVRAGKNARGTVGIHLAVVAKVGLALGVGTGGSEDLAWETSLSRGIDVLEDVTLSKDLSTRVSLESVGDSVEVVVDGVEKSVTSDLGGAAGGVVDVVVLEGDGVGGTGEVQAPVMTAVAGSRPRGGTVDLVVGDGNTVGGRVT